MNYTKTMTSFNQRFDMNADSVSEAMHYFQNRARQLLFGGFVWTKEQTLLKEKGEVWGVRTSFTKNKKTYQSVYVLASKRKIGMMSSYLSDPENRIPVVTVKDCDIEDYLNKMKLPYVIGNDFLETAEYKAVSSFYGNSKSQRSQLFKMNHIDEGLVILKQIGASLSSMKGFCLHPLLQNDEDLRNIYLQNWQVEPSSLILAMEYRWIANLYLSFRTKPKLKDIQLSPLKEVNEMLKADKIQNYKDFILYHKKTHGRSKELDEYFKTWLKKLGVSADDFKELQNLLLTVENKKV